MSSAHAFAATTMQRPASRACCRRRACHRRLRLEQALRTESGRLLPTPGMPQAAALGAGAEDRIRTPAADAGHATGIP
eukprot:349797-Chlamydomonas_euryale.AAC.3